MSAMLETCDIAVIYPDRDCGEGDRFGARNASSTSPVRRLARGEALFEAGDVRRALYRVEQGALCHYMTWPDGSYEVIEFAFPGDIIGLGNLDTYISTTKAMVEATVSILPADSLEAELRRDHVLEGRLSAMADREFDYLKARALTKSAQPVAARVAAVLAALAHMSSTSGTPAAEIEGRALDHVTEHSLGLAPELLRKALRELQGRGLIRLGDQNVALLDLPGLEKLADAA